MGIEEVNSKIIGAFTGVNRSAIVNGLGWLVFGIIIISLIGWFLWWWLDKKKFNKKVIAHSIVNGYFVPTYYDLAKSVKLGKGGFEILFLKKLKTWKLAHGARTGLNQYNFYVLPDGYWYPGQISGDLKKVDLNGGMINVVSTNPLMRSQYTSLEKQIDSLHAEKPKFWERYGNWVLSIAFIMIMGVFVWLSFREVSGFLGSGTELARQMNQLTESLNQLTINLNNQGRPSGIIPG